MVFFNPIPTLPHMLLVGFVPLANLVVWFRLHKKSPRGAAFLAVLNGVALGVSIIYTLLFLPLMPIAAIYTAMSFGALFVPALITVLPFGPMLSLAAEIVYGRRLARAAEMPQGQVRAYRAAGAVLGVLLLAGAELPRSITGIAVARLSADPGDAGAIRLIRNWGETETILRGAYGDPVSFRNFYTWTKSISDGNAGWSWFTLDDYRESRIQPLEARALYYRVTGKPFNSVPRPKSPFNLLAFTDLDVGGENVGGRTEHVSLVASTIDGSVIAETLTSYMEWTLELKNDDKMREQEARAEIALPAGGVVSRVTLWIDGKEVEALLGSRAEARAAYTAVVHRKRDPLLVTTSGPDRVLVQCYPILPRGGKMKIRIGITTPLVPLEHEARLSLPSIVERSFDIPPSVHHVVWIESKTPFRTAGPVLQTEANTGSSPVFRGEVEGAGSALENVSLAVALTTESGRVISLDDSQLITQTVEDQHFASKQSFVIVLDASAGMKPFLADTIAALKTAFADRTAAVLLAADEIEMLTPDFVRLDAAAMDEMLTVLRRTSFDRGVDSVPALRRALELTERLSDSAIIWIHAGQPIESLRKGLLDQAIKRMQSPPRIHSIRVGMNPDRLDDTLAELGILENLPPALEVRSLAEKLTAFTAGATYRKITRTASMRGENEQEAVAFKHVNRLWGAERINALRRESAAHGAAREDLLAEANAIAVRQRIVTPVSGAVVLEKTETEAAVAAGKLQPPTPGVVPTIPEPEMVVLFAALFSFALYSAIQTRLKHARR